MYVCTDMQTFARIWREPRVGLSGVGELYIKGLR